MYSNPATYVEDYMPIIEILLLIILKYKYAIQLKNKTM